MSHEGGTLTIYATIDVGSNSVLLHVARRLENGRFETLADLSAVTRLGESLHRTGVISERAATRTIARLEAYAAAMQAFRVRAFAAVGTMCLRVAANTPEFVARARDVTGIPIEVISGEEEARLSYVGAASSFGGEAGDIAVFDVGGGSTEFTFGKGRRVARRFSIDIGAVRLMETYLGPEPVAREALQQMARELEHAFARLGTLPSFDVLVGAGGTLTTMAAVMLELPEYDAARVHRAVLHTDEVERQLELYRSLTLEARQRIPGMQPGRADVILAGASIVHAVMARLGTQEVVVSDRGLRHGLLEDRFGA